MPDPTPLFNDDRRPRGGNGNGEPPITEMEVEKRLTAVESVIPTLATKTDVADLRADLHRMDASIKTWMLGTVVTIIGAMLAAIFGVAQMFRLAAPSVPTPPASAPIIINVPAPAPVPAPESRK